MGCLNKRWEHPCTLKELHQHEWGTHSRKIRVDDPRAKKLELYLYKFAKKNAVYAIYFWPKVGSILYYGGRNCC